MGRLASAVKLEHLDSLLQQGLKSQHPSLLPLKISCFSKGDGLVILLHYLEKNPPKSQDIFPILRKMLQGESSFSDEQIQMYLIVHGQSYQIEPEGGGREEIPAAGGGQPAPPTAGAAGKSSFPYLKLPWKVVAVYLSAAVVLGAVGYASSRPCVLSNCPEIAQAQQLADRAAIVAITLPSDGEILGAFLELEESLDILREIPPWSRFQGRAGTLLQEYQLKYQDLQEIARGIDLANQVTALVRRPPLNVSQWQEINNLWQQAIAALENVTKSSIFQKLATVKLQEYQNNLEYSQGKLSAEMEAVANLKGAEEAVRLARLRENSAQSLGDWRLVQATWKAAIQRLEGISPETTTYEEARRLLKNHVPQLNRSETRLKQEEFALQAYNKAIGQAKLAETAALKNQWSQAVDHWRNALTYIKQVPKNSFQNLKAEPLVVVYALSLNQAENKFKAAIEQEQIEQELERICTSSTKICDYFLGESIIKVSLKPNYIQKLWGASLQPQTQENYRAQIEIINDITRLEKGLQAISNRAKKRIEVYNSSGGLMAVYEASAVPAQP